jgi:predicted lipid-binding transport protein (Tim44 family)
MKRLKAVLATGLLSVLPAAGLHAQELMIYPAQGQSEQQQEKDKFECYGFAKSQSGFDPMAPPTASTAPPPAEAPQGGAGRGAVKGGLGGALVGAIAGDTKKGAAIGAVGGGLLGGARSSEQRRREDHNRQQWEQREAQQYSQNRNNYNRAYAACLEGRGYTVR